MLNIVQLELYKENVYLHHNNSTPIKLLKYLGILVYLLILFQLEDKEEMEVND